MRKILCAFILIIFVNISSRTIFAQNHYMGIDSLLIHYVDFNLMTMVDIGCDNFESALVYKTVVLHDSSPRQGLPFIERSVNEHFTTESGLQPLVPIYCQWDAGAWPASYGAPSSRMPLEFTFDKHPLSLHRNTSLNWTFHKAVVQLIKQSLSDCATTCVFPRKLESD